MCWFIFKKKIFKKFSLWKWIAWKNIQVYSDIWVCLWQNQQNDLCALESDQSGHLASLISLRCLHEVGIRPVWSVFAVHMKNHWVLGYPYSAQRRLWSDWADAQADLSLRWAHSCFVGFVMRRLFFELEFYSHFKASFHCHRNYKIYKLFITMKINNFNLKSFWNVICHWSTVTVSFMIFW